VLSRIMKYTRAKEATWTTRNCSSAPVRPNKGTLTSTRLTTPEAAQKPIHTPMSLQYALLDASCCSFGMTHLKRMTRLTAARGRSIHNGTKVIRTPAALLRTSAFHPSKPGPSWANGLRNSCSWIGWFWSHRRPFSKDLEDCSHPTTGSRFTMVCSPCASTRPESRSRYGSAAWAAPARPTGLHNRLGYAMFPVHYVGVLVACQGTREARDWARRQRHRTPPCLVSGSGRLMLGYPLRGTRS